MNGRVKDAVNNFIEEHGVRLEQHQFDALVSFTFNFGTGVWTQTRGTGDLYWWIAQLVRGGPPFDRGEAERSFTASWPNDSRRRIELGVFLDGY